MAALNCDDRVLCFTCLKAKEKKAHQCRQLSDRQPIPTETVIKPLQNSQKTQKNRNCTWTPFRIAALENMPINALLSDALSKQQVTA